MNIQEYIEYARNHKLTQKEIDDFNARMKKRNEEWEMREIQDRASNREFLNRTYTI